MVTFVRSVLFNPAVSGSSVTVTGLTLGGGDTIVISAEMGANVTLNSAADNGSGGSYNIISPAVEWSTFGVYLALLTGVVGSGATSLTFNFSGNPSTWNGNYDEFSGVGSVNASEGITNVASANPASSVTTTVANCALWSVLWDSVGFTAQPSGYTISFNNDSSTGEVGAYLIAGGPAGLQTATWTDAAGANAVGMVALAPAPVPPPALSVHSCTTMGMGIGCALWGAKKIEENPIVTRRSLILPAKGLILPRQSLR